MNRSMRVHVLLVVALVGCSSLRAATNRNLVTAPPPAPPSASDIGVRCTQVPATADDGNEIPFTAKVTCPFPQGYPTITVAYIEWIALMEAAITGALLDREMVMSFIPAQPAPAGTLTVAVHWTTANLAPSVYPLWKDAPGFRYNRAADLLGPEMFAAYHEVGETMREDDVYKRCKALVMDIDASTKDPSRAQACGTTMAVIDRNRTARSEQRYRAQQARAEERRLFLQQQQVHAMEGMERAQRWNNVLQALPHQTTTSTSCRRSFGGSMDCTSTSR
jgi:hypothetical protein